MANVIPTLRTAVRQTYTPPALRRKSDTRQSTGNPTTVADFRTVLKKQSEPAAIGLASASRTIGTITAGSPAPVVTSPAPVVTSPAPVVTSPAPVVTSPAPASSMAPTAQSLFGANPWVTTAFGTGPAGNSYGFNPYYFATPATAAKVAQMLGGTVVTQNDITPYGPFKQSQPNLMVQMPDGSLHNAGLIAAVYDHGYSQVTVDRLMAGEMSG